MWIDVGFPELYINFARKECSFKTLLVFNRIPPVITMIYFQMTKQMGTLGFYSLKTPGVQCTCFHLYKQTRHLMQCIHNVHTTKRVNVMKVL